MRIAVVQDEASPRDVAGNIAKAAGWVRAAGADGVRLLVLPETFTTSWDLDVFAGQLPVLESGQWLDPLQEAVEETGVVTVLSTALAGVRPTIADVLVAPGREPVAAYAKQHLYPPERDHFEAGEHGATLEIDGVRVGLSICYDANFPEHAAAAGADGAILYVNSGAYFPGGAHRRDLHHAARALDNGMYVAFAGLVGGSHGFIGGAAVFDPLGQAVERLDHGRPGMAVVDVDPGVVAKVREEQRMWADRRADLGLRETTRI